MDRVRNVDKSKQQKYKHRNVTSLNLRGSHESVRKKTGPEFSGDEKGVRWMPRHGMPMKDVAACEKPRLGGKQPLTRGYPNEETHLEGSSRYHALNI